MFHAPDQQAGQLYARADPYEPQSAVLADHGGRFVHAAADEHNGQLAIGGEDIRPAAKHGHAPPDPIRRLGQRFQIRGAFKRGECQRPAPQVQGGQRSHARRRNDPYHRFSSFPFVSQENDSVEYYFLQGAKPVHLIKGHLSGHAPPFAPQAFRAERMPPAARGRLPLDPVRGASAPRPPAVPETPLRSRFSQQSLPVPYNGTPVAQPPPPVKVFAGGGRERTLFTKSALPRLSFYSNARKRGPTVVTLPAPMVRKRSPGLRISGNAATISSKF